MITWIIEKLSAVLSDAELTGRQAEGPVVVQVHWRVTAKEGAFTGNVSGQQQFTYDPETEFTPYDQLTEAQILGWVHAAMGNQRQAFEEMVRQQIEQQMTAPIVLPLPWHVPPPAISGNGHDGLVG